MLKVVITGASGFLGSNLINKLKNNSDVMIYALSSKKIESSSDNIIYFHKDVIDSVDSKDILNNAIVVNCAFPRNSTGTEIADGLAYINRLFMSCKRYKVKAIINISSQSVYSQKRETIADENTEVCLESSYAVGKYATELMLESICEGTDVKYTNLRMASLIGPGFDQRIVNRLVKKAIALEPITISVSNQSFGFLDIYDAVDAIFSLLKVVPSVWKHIYNVGSGNGVSLEEIIECIIDIFKNNDREMSTVNYVNENKVGSTALSFELLHEDTGFSPRINLRMSTARIFESIKNSI